jgi:hypothetical protein
MRALTAFSFAALALACSAERQPHDAGALRDAGVATDGGTIMPARDAGRDAGSAPDAGQDAGMVDPFDAGPRPPSPTFTDVTESAGLAQPHRIPASCIIEVADNCEINYMTGGAASGDIDGDGWPDLYVTMLEGPDYLYRNRGDGTFEDVSDASGIGAYATHSNGAVFADVDEDGDLDLYVTTIGIASDPANARYYLFVNDGAGRFTEEAVARGAAFDDGTVHSGQSIAAGDYDRDGYVDLYVTEWLPRPTFRPHNRLLHNRGASMPGHFEDITVASGALTYTQRCWDREVSCTSYAFAASFTDFDEDGWPDLLVVADFGTTKLFWNRANGTFDVPVRTSSMGGDQNGMGSTAGDFDGDGDLDWLVTSIFDPALTCETMGCNWLYSGNRLYRNDGSRTWSDATDAAGVRDLAWGWGAAMFDHDNDGDLDVVGTDGVSFPNTTKEDHFNADPMRFWDNDGTGRMTERAAEVGLTDRESGKGLLVFDYDGDGDLDVFICNNGGLPRLYRNDGGNAMPWLRVRGIGTTSTSEALGARVWVRVHEGGPQQERELGSVSHYLGQSERIVHFGLGPSATRVAELDVRWPNGEYTRLRDLEPNQTIELVEPAP